MELTELKAAVDTYADASEASITALDGRLAALETKMARPEASADYTLEQEDSGALAYKGAFLDDFILKGDETQVRKLAARSLEEKALSTSSATGTLVPEDIDGEIERQLLAQSPLRSYLKVKAIETGSYKRLVSTGGTASGWAGEEDARTETTAPGLREIVIDTGELYSNAAATQRALDDMQFDAEQWLMEEVADEFAAKETAAIISGSGVNQPRGILSGGMSADSDGARTFGYLQYRLTGVSGGWKAADPSDDLIDLVHDLNPRYRQGAIFVMNSKTLADVRKFKDADGNFIWRPGLQDGQPDRLLGYPVIEVEDMPDVAADSFSVAFGNFERGYTLVERTGTRVLRDPYSNKPYVHFYATRRVGGALINDAAIKLLKFGTT
ncbi:phage capsid protein [Kordiimonas sediminis]|uniref:Phage capsid protein n=2 Tax=Kordiimonas sediminis TaxID=1735581 RepID=A0A919E679_9PROT|nr:phage capsid protein [Kordiimonas sediminis]